MTWAASTLKIDQAETSALSGTYRLLARLWLREADEMLLTALREPPMCDLFEQAGGLPPQAEVDALAVDFCQLFVGPSGHLPPYQSVWQSGQFQSQAIHSMRDFADLVEYDFASPPHATLPDHLGLQLDVMGSILERVSNVLAEKFAIESEQAASSDHLVAAVEVAQTFFQRHLTWPEPLLSAAAPRATTNFYRSAISLTREFLESERQHWSP
jgi:TorA maturation chaperone TorD